MKALKSGLRIKRNNVPFLFSGKRLRSFLIFTFLTLFSINTFSCTCNCEGDCSFSVIAKTHDFVALVKVIEYSDYIESVTMNPEDRLPYSMTVEIVKLYKGKETRKRIKIWGDNGMLCRPYTSNFEVGGYYLITPREIAHDSEFGKAHDYEFFSCWSDYLKVDFGKKVAVGNYSRWKSKISLEKFEKKLKEQ